MSQGLSVASADAALTAAIANWVAAQLHTADPGSAGTTAVSTTTTREGLTWGSPSAGSVAITNTPVWPSWAGTNGEVETYISGWSSATAGAGSFGGSIQLSASVTMDTGDSLTLTAVSIALTPTAS